MDKKVVGHAPTVQFQMPHFVLGGSPNLDHSGAAEVLPGMYATQDTHAWPEYDKNWYDPSSYNTCSRVNVTPRPFEFGSPQEVATPPSLPMSSILVDDDRDTSPSCRVVNDQGTLVLSNPSLFVNPLSPDEAPPTTTFTFSAPNFLDPTAPLPPLPSNGLPLYSASGFDMLRMLAKVATRPNPKVMLGPVDMTCSFVVVDVRRLDSPIVYASPTFTRLTGYSETEVLGRNCRFLQSPSGHLQRGDPRHFTSPDAVRHLHKSLLQDKECQACLINYRNDGSAFINLVTVIPISAPEDERDGESGEITHCVGFQVDLAKQPNAILQKLRDGSYLVNYSSVGASSTGSFTGPGFGAAGCFTGVRAAGGGGAVVGIARERRGKGISAEMVDLLPKFRTYTSGIASAQLGDVNAAKGARDAEKAELHTMLLANTDDFIHVVSLKGSLLYVSPAITRVLGHDPAELVGKSIADLCHPADVVPLMRELKEASSGPVALQPQPQLHPHALPHPSSASHHSYPLTHLSSSAHASSSATHPSLFMLPQAHQTVPPPPKPVNLLFRALHKSGAYVWLGARGRLHVEQGKGRKAVVLVGRRVDVESMESLFARGRGLSCSPSSPSAAAVGDAEEKETREESSLSSLSCCSEVECWGLVAPNGLILSASPVGAYRLGFAATAASSGFSPLALASCQWDMHAGLVGRSMASLVVGSGSPEEEGRRVGEVLAGAACADREEVRSVRCRMRVVGASATAVSACPQERREGSQQARDATDGQPAVDDGVSVEIRFYARERRRVSGSERGRGRRIEVNGEIQVDEEKETEVAALEERRRTSSLPPSLVFQILFLAPSKTGMRRCGNVLSPSTMPSVPGPVPMSPLTPLPLPLISSSSSSTRWRHSPPSHLHPHPHRGASCPLSSLSPLASSHLSHAPPVASSSAYAHAHAHALPLSNAPSAGPSISICMPCSSPSSSSSSSPISSTQLSSASSCGFPSTSPSAETSWQYELTRLRFENERMREEVMRLELEHMEHLERQREHTAAAMMMGGMTSGRSAAPGRGVGAMPGAFVRGRGAPLLSSSPSPSPPSSLRSPVIALSPSLPPLVLHTKRTREGELKALPLPPHFSE